MRLLFALSGFHRYNRGAETALLSVAQELACTGDEVTVAGSGQSRSGCAYRFVHVPAVARETFERIPALPFFRNETQWEDASFAARLPFAVDLRSYDAALTCAYPYTNWALRRMGRKPRPAQVFVTQNSDWPAYADNSEYRFFNCDGLICTNPAFYERNHGKWKCALIPNGIDLARFTPGDDVRTCLGLPCDKAIVLMVSAFIDTKRVLEGIRAVAKVKDAVLVVAGDGPLRLEGDRLAAQLLPNRYRRISLPADRMPDLYRSADVFLHLSKDESFGNVYLEAAATGLPIVAHDYALTQWILDDAPFLCDTDDEEMLVAKLEHALKAGSQPVSPSLGRFTWNRIADDYRAFLRGVVDSRTSA